MTTIRTEIPALTAGGSGNEILVNEAFIRLEAGIVAVESFGDTTPPSGVNGNAYVLGAAPTGDWSGQGGNIAFYLDGWDFISMGAANEGLRVWVDDEDRIMVWNGSAWESEYGGVNVLSDGATIDWDLSLGKLATVTLGGNRTLNNPTNLRQGEVYTLRVTQDGTGSRALTFSANYVFAGGTPPTLSTGGGDVDVFTFVCTGASELTMVGSALDVS